MEETDWPVEETPPADVAEGDTPEAEEADDPLADLDEETRTRLEAHYAAREEAVAARARDEEQKRFHRATGRWGHASQVFDSEFGVTVDESGRPAVVDPQKFRAAADRFAAASTAPAATPEEDEPLDIYNPEKLQQQVQARTQREVKAAVQPLMEAIERLGGQLLEQATPTYAEGARPFLAQVGQEELLETPEFRTAFRQALAGFPADQQRTPMAQQMAAGMALPVVLQQRAQNPPEAQPPRRDPRAAATQQAARAGLAQIGGSRDSGGRPAPDAADTAVAEELAAMFPGERITPAMARALADDPTGREYARLKNGRSR